MMTPLQTHSDVTKILILHGPNLPLLGKVSANTASRLTLNKIDTALRRQARSLGIELKIWQFYDEARLLKTISRGRREYRGVLISPGSLCRSCYALRELLAILRLPVVEIHLAEFPFAEEDRRVSVLQDVVCRQIVLPGLAAYQEGLEQLIAVINRENGGR